MVATGRKQFGGRMLSYLQTAMLLTAAASGLLADQSAEVRSRLSEIATSLTAGDPAGAMAPFSKSFPNYQRLREDFSGLTNAFSIVNEVDVIDEADSKAESVVTVNWAITLTNPQNKFNTQHSAEIHVRFIREKGNLKIVEFSPIAIFDPSQSQTPIRPPHFEF